MSAVVGMSFQKVCKKKSLTNTLTLTNLVTACLFSRISVTAMKSCCIFSWNPQHLNSGVRPTCLPICLLLDFSAPPRSIGENSSLMIIQKILSKYFMLIMNQKGRAFTEFQRSEEILQISNFKLHYRYQYASYSPFCAEISWIFCDFTKR